MNLPTMKLINIFWRELGYPNAGDTWESAEAPADQVVTVTRRLVTRLRKHTAGLHSLRVYIDNHPSPVQAHARWQQKEAA